MVNTKLNIEDYVFLLIYLKYMLLYKTKKFSGEVYNVCGYNMETIIKDDAREGEGK